MRSGLCAVVLGLAVCGVLGIEGAEAKKPKPTPCPGGRWPAAGTLDGTPVTAIAIDGQQVALEGACEAVRARRKVSRASTVLRARWRRCGAEQGVSLVARLDNGTCETLRGALRSRNWSRRALDLTIEWPAGASGKSTDPLPEGAVLVTQDELDALRAERPTHPENPEQAAADAAAAAADEAEDDAVIAEFLAAHPDRAAAVAIGVDPADPTLQSADDGNYLHSVTDSTGAPFEVTTLGRRAQKALLAAAIRRLPTLDNQVRTYRELYDFGQSIDPALVAESPESLAALGVDEVAIRNTRLVGYFFDNLGQFAPPPGGTPPAGYPQSCAAEVGAGAGSDRTGAVCEHRPLGVYANRSWPLKFFATCVKNQARRGTCVSFAMNGAVELLGAKKYGVWHNLSEQYLYFMAKAVWWPSSYGDGLGTHDVWQRQITTGFVAPFEQDWDYNPSWSRTANDATRTYSGSCTGYTTATYPGVEAEYCSNTNHQGRLVCVNVGLFRFCLGVPPAIASSGQALRPKAEAELWDASSASAVDLSFAKLVLALGLFGKPVMLGLPVTPSFDAADANGYVVYRGPHCPVEQENGQWVCRSAPTCECDRGGHAVLATGVIANEQLPSGAPAGAGGGYVIVKNSWGACFADAGYIYLPYQWIKDMLYSATVLSDIH